MDDDVFQMKAWELRMVESASVAKGKVEALQYVIKALTLAQPKTVDDAIKIINNLLEYGLPSKE